MAGGIGDSFQDFQMMGAGEVLRGFGFVCLVLWSMGGELRAQAGKLIRIVNSDRVTGTRDVSYLGGNVVFEHEGARMYCDSAVRYLNSNVIKAFGNIRLNQGDTLTMTAHAMEYDGNTRVARAKGDVVLRDPEMTLTTQRLELDRNINTAYYTTGGTITNDENVLKSQIGMYYAGPRMFSFKKNVELLNPRYRMECDTLQYFTTSRVAHFIGPTHIYSDSGQIYCENGRYNTVMDEAMFNHNAVVKQKNIELRGDSLYYHQRLEIGYSRGNIAITDTAEKFTVYGQEGVYKGKGDEVVTVTGRPLFLSYSEPDTLYISGDTIRTVKVDSSGHRQMYVYRDMRLYRKDLQGKADSLYYTSADSAFHLYGRPVLWSDTTQITGGLISITMSGNQPDSLFVFENAFILAIESDTFYNQIRGRDLKGNFEDRKLSKVLVIGNGQTVYYVKEEDGTFIGVNRADCSNLLILFAENKVKEIKFITKPDSRLIPLGMETDEDVRLKNFENRFGEKPELYQFKDLMISAP
ncbi:OstA-like protein [Schleiferia thermophila]|uniref:OstA-like protein n=1 Tax=Schleiferia thermophila TaxID=884107 RepID=UPI003EEB2E77